MNEKQKDNLAKFTYDLARIVAGVAVITPLFQSGKASIPEYRFGPDCSPDLSLDRIRH